MTMINLAPSPEDDRCAERISVDIAAGLRLAAGRRVPVLIRNISVDGFMIEGGSTAVPGSLVTLDLFDGSGFPARVVWSREGHVGGAFVTPLARETLALIA